MDTNTDANNKQELTLHDLAKLIQRNATKEDIDSIVTARINTYQQKTDKKIDEIQRQVETATDMGTENSNKIEELQSAVETLKQDQLRSNICISGVPAEQITDGNTSDIVMKIANALNVTLSKNQFTSHPVASKKFIIVHFHNHSYKQQLLIRVRAKKSLMVEEVFNTKSNSQIYLNDHLTPYFTKLHLIARNARKEGKFASVSSYGGKIRVRKNPNDAPIIIVSEKQIQTLVEIECADSSTDSIQCVDDANAAETSNKPKKPTQRAHQKQNNKNIHQNRGRGNSERATQPQPRQNLTRTKTDKRKAEGSENEEDNEQRKKAKIKPNTKAQQRSVPAS